MYRPGFLLLFLVNAVPVLAEPWSFELGGRFGSQYGTLRDQDNALYANTLVIRYTDSTGKVLNSEPVDLRISALTFDLAAFRVHGSGLQIGAGISWMHAKSEPDNFRHMSGDQDLEDRLATTARLRWLPWEHLSKGKTSAIEVEPALGLGYAWIRRYGLAAAELDGGALGSAHPIAKTYIATANRSLSAIGPHTELFLNYSSTRSSGFQYRFGFGFTASLLQILNDPLLSDWTYQGKHYPSSIEDLGFCIRATVGFRS